MVAIATSEKGFTTWREPGGEEENGMAEGVGVPARTLTFHVLPIESSMRG